MSMHCLTGITLGVPNPEPVGTYYERFGLQPLGENRFATVEGGHQLTLAQAPVRKLLEIGIGVDSEKDLDVIGARLTDRGEAFERDGDRLIVAEPVSGTRISLSVSPRIEQAAPSESTYNGPGYANRRNARTPAYYRTETVRPRRLGHIVIASVDWERTRDFLMHGLGFKESDTVGTAGVFMRCSLEHHNIFVLNGKANFLHHTGWQVEDLDEVGRGGRHMVETYEDTHIWGPGRHFIGSNFFWYMRDPAGNYAEYYADMDHIDEDEPWEPGLLKGGGGWHVPMPHVFHTPEDLDQFMAGVY